MAGIGAGAGRPRSTASVTVLPGGGSARAKQDRSQTLATPAELGKLPARIAQMLQDALLPTGCLLSTLSLQELEREFHVICRRGQPDPCIVLLYLGGRLGDHECCQELEATRSILPAKPYVFILGDCAPHLQCHVMRATWKYRVEAAEFLYTPAFCSEYWERLAENEKEKIRKAIRIMTMNTLPAIDQVLTVNPVSPIQGVANEPQRKADERNNPDVFDAQPQRTGVFISYSHEDAKWLKEIQTCLKPFKTQVGKIFWDDTEIQTGQKWRDEIRKALVAAKVAVLLITRNFVASDFITQQELPPLLEEAQNEGLKLHCVYVGYSSFGKIFPDALQFQGGNDPRRPLISLSESEREDQLVRIAEAIVEDLKK